MFSAVPLRRWRDPLAAALLLGWISTLSLANGTPVNTQISNTATISYTDESGYGMTPAISDPVVVEVTASPGVEISPARQWSANTAGQTIYYPILIRNTGNLTDTLDLTVTTPHHWQTSLIQDANQDGIHQSTETTTISDTGAMAPDAELKLFVEVLVPSGMNQVTDDCTIRVASRSDIWVYTSAIVSTTATISPRKLSPVWSCDLGSSIQCSPTIVDGIAYIGTDDGHLYAVQATGTGAGNILWKFPSGYGVGGAVKGRPVYYRNAIYIASENGSLYCVNLSGTQIWNKKIAPTGFYIEGTPAAFNGLITVASTDGYLTQLNASDGTLAAQSMLLSSAPSSSPAIPLDGMIWFGSSDGNIISLSPDLETMRWIMKIGDGAILSSPSLDPWSGTMIIGSPDGSILALNSSTGTNMWGPVSVGGPITTAPWIEAYDRTVFLTGGDHKIYALQIASGSSLSGYPFAPVGTGGITSSPLVLAHTGGEKYLYAGGSDGKMVAVPVQNPSNYAVFDLVEAAEPAGAFNASPAASGLSTSDVFVIGCTNGKLYGFLLQ